MPMTDLCPSCKEPVDHPSGDGCAAMTRHQPHQCPSPEAIVMLKPLHWEDADQGFCTKWKAAALGGHYELVWFEDKKGFSVNFSWGRPLSFWFIQGEPDEYGPTGPKSFTTLDQAKAAAQADYEARILSALEPTTPSPEAIVRAALKIILADAQILRWIAEGYDKEDAAMIGEPDPWLLDDAGDIGDAETWQAERIGCARCGLLHAIARIPLASDPAKVAAIIEKAGERHE